MLTLLMATGCVDMIVGDASTEGVAEGTAVASILSGLGDGIGAI